MNPHVLLVGLSVGCLVGWLVCWTVGWSVCHYFLKEQGSYTFMLLSEHLFYNVRRPACFYSGMDYIN